MNLVLAIWNLLNGTVVTNQQKILRKLDQILEILEPTPPTAILFNVTHDDGTTKENVVADSMTADQKATLTLDIRNPVTGKPAPVDGAPIWASSDDTVATITPSVDGMTAVAAGVIAGENRISVQADADLGAGVKTISGLLVLTITPGADPVMTITMGTPESQ